MSRKLIDKERPDAHLFPTYPVTFGILAKCVYCDESISIVTNSYSVEENHPILHIAPHQCKEDNND